MTFAERIATPMPEGISKLPKDARGYPIPYIVAYRDGKPDFTTQDAEKFEDCLKNKKCHVCGEVMTKGFFYIASDMTPDSGVFNFTDPAICIDCAWYSIKVCPFMANPNAKHKPGMPQEDKIVDYEALEKLDNSRTDNLYIVGSIGYRTVPMVAANNTTATAIEATDVFIILEWNTRTRHLDNVYKM